MEVALHLLNVRCQVLFLIVRLVLMVRALILSRAVRGLTHSVLMGDGTEVVLLLPSQAVSCCRSLRSCWRRLAFEGLKPCRRSYPTFFLRKEEVDGEDQPR